MIPFELGTIDLDKLMHRLIKFQNRFASHFRTKTRNVTQQSLHYLQGKFHEKGCGNMTKYIKYVPGSNNQALQNFISESPWDEKPVIDQIQKEVINLIGDADNGSIHLDESSFKKSGNNSVGVMRQYCGRLGKVDNCQVGVFLSYTNETHRTLIDERLYLPKKWTSDPDRLKKCGVPSDITFKTKAELGLEMMQDAINRKIPFAWVGMDCFYGEQPQLLNEIAGKGLTFIADIPFNTRVFLDMPKVEIPEKKGTRGRKPTRKRVAEGEPKSIQVRELANQLDFSEYHHIYLRDSERKEMWCQMACKRIYPVVDGLPGKEIWVIIRKDDGEKLTKYQYSNAPPDTTVERFGQMSCSRYWIERAFQDGKGIAGMADYQVRGWKGWHHHMVMTMLAMLFIMEMQVEWEGKAPMLTVQDVKEILEVIMPRREIIGSDILEMIRQKHKDRHAARESHHRCNRK